jgi:homocysteine S-methyltransferase
MLADGSEFNGWYTDSMTIEVDIRIVYLSFVIYRCLLCKQLKDWHRPRFAILARAEPDLFAFETIPSTKEAEALMELLKEYPNVKAWLSFHCQVMYMLM